MKLKSRKKDILFIFIILIIQTTVFIIAGINKSYIHMDEAYSLGLASYNKTNIQQNEDFYNTWHTKEYYEAVKGDCGLNNINDIDEYLSSVNMRGHSIIIAASGDWTANLRQSTIDGLKDLGLKFDIQNGERCSYIAVIDDGRINEQKQLEKIEDRIYIGNTAEYCEIISDGNDTGEGSIAIAEKLSLNGGSGINVVVYNNYMMKVVDAVSFNTCMEEGYAVR